MPSCNAFNYVTRLLKSDFTDFLTDMKYDDDKYVELMNYPGTKFMHHDFIADQNGSGELTAKMMMRANRFMNRIDGKNPFFICAYERFYSEIPDAAELFSDSVRAFKKEIIRRGVSDFQIMLVIYDNQPFELASEFKKALTSIGVHVRTFVRDPQVDTDYGSEEAFKPILAEFFNVYEAE